MQIGIIGNGSIASGLGAGWIRAGHQVRLTGRDPARVAAAAERIGAVPVEPTALAEGCDAVLLAVRWEGVPEAIDLVGRSLHGVPLIDPTNAVEHGVGRLLTDRSAAEAIADRSGAHVVKGFHLFPADQWASPAAPARRVVVPLAGDDDRALAAASQLVRDLAAEPVVVGGLDRARQLEEAAGFVIALAFAGTDPQAAIPTVG
ncbi:MAG TPA: NAD(P)-binding domain-containing protein [Acidimicrobiales bacterium]|nr:NAD(P)-binding domain-containing protein [Acidimicrobiales bacterium]